MSYDISLIDPKTNKELNLENIMSKGSNNNTQTSDFISINSMELPNANPVKGDKSETECSPMVESLNISTPTTTSDDDKKVESTFSPDSMSNSPKSVLDEQGKSVETGVIISPSSDNAVSRRYSYEQCLSFLNNRQMISSISSMVFRTYCILYI